VHPSIFFRVLQQRMIVRVLVSCADFPEVYASSNLGGIGRLYSSAEHEIRLPIPERDAASKTASVAENACGERVLYRSTHCRCRGTPRERERERRPTRLVHSILRAGLLPSTSLPRATSRQGKRICRMFASRRKRFAPTILTLGCSLVAAS